MILILGCKFWLFFCVSNNNLKIVISEYFKWLKVYDGCLVGLVEVVENEVEF